MHLTLNGLKVLICVNYKLTDRMISNMASRTKSASESKICKKKYGLVRNWW